MPTVYLVQEPRAAKDLSSAQRYGTLQPILGAGDDVGLTPGPALHKLARALRRFAGDDYLCAAGGDPLGLALALVALRNETPLREVQFLRWERERDIHGRRLQGVGFYVPTKVQLYV